MLIQSALTHTNASILSPPQAGDRMPSLPPLNIGVLVSK